MGVESVERPVYAYWVPSNIHFMNITPDSFRNPIIGQEAMLAHFRAAGDSELTQVIERAYAAKEGIASLPEEDERTGFAASLATRLSMMREDGNEPENFAAYHLLIGSSVPPTCGRFDTEDTIFTRLAEIYLKNQQRKKAQ